MQLEIKQMRGALIKTFPKRVVQMRDMRKKVMSLEDYIKYLHTLLQQNHIPYEERKIIRMIDQDEVKGWKND